MRRSRKAVFFELGVAVLWCLLPIIANGGGVQRMIKIIAQTEDGAPLPSAIVTIKRGAQAITTSMTDDKGVAMITNFSAGKYEITISKDGFQPFTQEVTLEPEASLEVKFTLVPKIEVSDKIEVTASANAAAQPEQTSSAGTELQTSQTRYLPSQPTTVADTLPLVPGVIRTFQGEIKISGAGENRSAFVVNSADVTDPATGQFGMTVPVDAVQTINVFKTPYLAQYGRFTAGVVSVETKRGGDKWNFELNDPLPEFRYLDGHLRGLREATPRIVFNGPLIKDKLFISNGTEYAIRKRPIRTLEYPNKETKSESINSFTQFDYLISGVHTLTGTFHYAPRKDSFVNLDFFNRRPVTPNWRGKDYTGTIIDRLTLGANLLESTVSVKHFTVNVYGQDRGEMNLSPIGNTGNYFSEQERVAQRVEWMEVLSLKPIQLRGAHNLKFGSVVGGTENTGQFWARPVNILNTAGQRLRRIEFAGGRRFDRNDLEVVGFVQDHWVLGPKLAVDMGTRVERQGITETFRIAPRLGIAWSPFDHQRTILRTGYGIFYDRVPLNVYSFDRNPEQVMITYAPDGSIVDGPRRFVNITDAYERKGNPLVYGKTLAGNFAPYSSTWSVEVEHAFPKLLKLRANYLSSNSEGLILVSPRVVSGQDALVLSGSGRMRYRQLELTARVQFDENRQQVFLSYVNSRSRGDVNEFNTYIGNFPFPVVRNNQFARGSADLPHRFLGWGLFQLPWKMRFAPIVEYRNGLPYSLIDATQNFVGIPNSRRFPKFFSFDARVSKDFQINPKYAVRFSLSGFNLSNHFNALDVRRNTGDPQVGVFFGNFQRQFRLDFDVLF